MHPGLDMALFGVAVMAFVIVDAIVRQEVFADFDDSEPW